MIKKYLVILDDFNGLFLTEETASNLMPGVDYEKVNDYFDKNRSDKTLIEYLEKNGIKNCINNNASILEEEETEDYTFKIESYWNSYNDCPSEELVQIPIIRKKYLDGKSPDEIIAYLKKLDIDFIISED